VAMDELKEKILTNALKHVPFDGWSEAVLRCAVKETGYDAAYAEILFPDGVVELVELFIARADRSMLAALSALPLAEMKVRERIRAALRLRLEQAEPVRAVIRRTLTFCALPHHAARATVSLWRTVDSIWYAAGDSATDYNYYTKRLLLSGVYSSTLLYWLDDESENMQATLEFLDRRIEDIMKIGNLRKLVEGVTRKLRHIPFVRLAFLR
jgi:ubiquinone biosynthesis protein COQ9